MKKNIMATFTCLTAAFAISLASAGDAERGAKLFADPGLGGGKTGKSCQTCHEGGEMLDEDLFDREEYVIMGKKGATLADIVNICIEGPLNGKAIDPKGEDMADLLSHMKTLIKKEEKKGSAKKLEGC